MLKQDTITEAWRVFSWKLAAELTVQPDQFKMINTAPCIDYHIIIYILKDCQGLDKVKLKDPDAEEIRVFFLAYFKYINPLRIEQLKQSWEKLQDDLKGLLAFWEEIDWFQDDSFRKAQICN